MSKVLPESFESFPGLAKRYQELLDLSQDQTLALNRTRAQANSVKCLAGHYHTISESITIYSDWTENEDYPDALSNVLVCEYNDVAYVVHITVHTYRGSDVFSVSVINVYSGTNKVVNTYKSELIEYGDRTSNVGYHRRMAYESLLNYLYTGKSDPLQEGEE